MLLIMNPACLTIKFRPLITTVHKKSLCCLEIIPEISGLENLDTDNWNDDELEYSIPLVYKVKLKRRNSHENDQKTNVTATTDDPKTYHSCVDLLYTDTLLDEGDCTKNISDSYIFGKLLSDIQNFSKFLEKLENKNSLIALHNKCQSEHRLETVARDVLVDAQVTNVIELHDGATEDNILDEKATSNNAFISRLSVTPIWSFNTNSLSDKEVNLTTGTQLRCLSLFEPAALPIYEKKNGCGLPNLLAGHVRISEKADHQSKLDKLLAETTPTLPQFTTQLTVAQYRITKFRILMKKEITPLNEMLDKLIEKCVYLGIKKKKFECDAPVCKLRSSWSGPNRVVYTIVSEG